MDVDAALNKLCKWRTVLTGWHMGTRAKNEPGVQAMRDLQDHRLVIRCEMTALTAILIEKGVFTSEEFAAQLVREAYTLDKQYEAKFPGYHSTQDGISIDAKVAMQTNARLGFPP